MKKNNKFQDKLRKLRLDNGLTQVELAKMIRVSQGYITDMERGRRKPSGTTILALAYKFGINENYLEN